MATTRAFLSQRQAGELCGMSARTIARAIDNGELVGERGPKDRSPMRISRGELQRWAAAQGLTLQTPNGQVDPDTGEVIEPTPIERATKARQRLAGVAVPIEADTEVEAPRRRGPVAAVGQAEQLGELRGVLESVRRLAGLAGLQDNQFRAAVRALLAELNRG